jgi:hypothetical protein
LLVIQGVPWCPGESHPVATQHAEEMMKKRTPRWKSPTE